MRFLTPLLIFFLLYNSVFAENCIEERYVFDIGSGTTKMLAKKIDTCQNQHLEKIAYTERKNRYVDCINSSNDIHIAPQECLNKGLNAIKSITNELSIDCKVKNCLGITTAWSRNIENGFDMIEMLKDEGIQAFILSQKEEGYLVHKAVEHEVNKPEYTFVSWDIGGGSSQLGFWNGEATSIVKVPYGIDNYSLAIREHLGVEANKVLSLEESNKAVNYLQNKILKNIDFKFMHDKKPVYGAGRVFNNAMLVELNLPSQLHISYLEHLIKFFGTHTEQEIKQKFPKIDTVKNTQMCLIYIFSFMSKSKLDTVSILNINVNDYLLIANEYWS